MTEKILIVDDDKYFSQELGIALSSFAVLEARNGQEALKILNAPNEIDLIILDVMMPGLSGTDILKIIRKRRPEIGIIMLTGFGSKETAIESLRGQADEYLEKPVDINKLKEAIEKLLENKKYRAKPGSSEMQNKVERVKRLIERNWTKKLSLKSAAEIVSLTPKYLSRLFKEISGKGFKEFEIGAKIERAKKLLRNTPHTVSEISNTMGFANPESFIRIFKKYVKLTPKEFRKKQPRK